MSQLGQFQFLEILETLTGNTGDIVHPQVGNINILGSGHITINGNNTTATLNVSLDGGVADSFVTDSGTIVPISGVVNVLGGDNINTVGSGNTITIHLDESIVLPVTSSDGLEGLYSLGSNRFMHARGTLNTFLGQSAGALGLTVATAVNNVGVGSNVLNAIATSSYTTSVGVNSANLLTGGANNSFYGAGAGSALVNGSNNTLIAKDAGSAYVSNESSNICIGNIGVAAESNIIRIGTTGSGAAQQNKIYVAAAYGVTPGGTINLALVDSNGQLGSVATLGVDLGGTGAATLTDNGVLYGNGTSAIGATAEGATGTVLIGNTGNPPSFSASPTVTTVYATTFDTNVATAGVTLSGTTLSADGSDTDININITAKGTGQVIIDDLQLGTDLEVQYGGTGASSFTDHGVLLGSGSSAISATAAGTNGQLLTAVTSNDPTWTTASYPSTVNKGDVLVASANNVVDIVAGATTAGYALIANGVNTVPSFQALPSVGIQTLAGDSGTATGSTVTIAGGSNITTSAATSTLTVDLDNSITLSGDVTALNLKTSTAAANLTLNSNTITSDGVAADIDINLVAKGAGGLTFDGISTGYSDSQWHLRQEELQTTDATPTALVTIPLVEGEMITINATINGFQSDFTDACGATCSMTCYRPTGGNVTQVGEEIINVNSTSTAVISADVNVGTQSMVIYATGVAAETWNWVSTHQYMFTKTNA